MKEIPDVNQKNDLTRRDWIVAALRALVEGGVGAVRVERLAKALKVTKGSFYWHFKDRGDLLSALLDLWDTDFTQQLIENAAHLHSPKDRLRALAREALEPVMLGVDSGRGEVALQAWAALDANVAERLRRVEATRVGYLRDELRAAGLSESAADSNAKSLYLALVGLYAARAYNPELADDEVYMALVDTVLNLAD